MPDGPSSNILTVRSRLQEMVRSKGLGMPRPKKKRAEPEELEEELSSDSEDELGS